MYFIFFHDLRFLKKKTTICTQAKKKYKWASSAFRKKSRRRRRPVLVPGGYPQQTQADSVDTLGSWMHCPLWRIGDWNAVAWRQLDCPITTASSHQQRDPWNSQTDPQEELLNTWSGSEWPYCWNDCTCQKKLDLSEGWIGRQGTTELPAAMEVSALHTRSLGPVLLAPAAICRKKIKTLSLVCFKKFFF